MRKIWFYLAILITSMGILSACSAGNAKDRSDNLHSLATRAVSRMTAEAESDTTSEDSSIQEAQTTATQVAQSLVATQTAQSDVSSESQKATETAFSPFQSELGQYGVDPDKGQPGWIHPPLTLELNEFHSYKYDNHFIGTVVEDFVISSDITWNTEYGGSGCGFILRSDGNENSPSQYMVVATRAASGHIVFAVISGGNLVGGQDIYAYGIDRNFDFHNDATNRLTVVGRGNKLEIYTNGVLIGEVDPNAPLPQPRIPDPPIKPSALDNPKLLAAYAQAKAEYDLVVEKIKADFQARLKAATQANKNFERGLVAMVALSESGHTQCQFDRSWLWLIESPQ